MIKAIETTYAGCRFRSRLEARWAVFFDHLEIAWEYEPQGYESDAGRYLPDFWLPDERIWVEVKGRFTHEDLVRTVESVFALREPPDKQVMPQLLILGPVPRPGLAWVHVRLDIVLTGFMLWQQVFFYSRSGWLTKPIAAPMVFEKGAFGKAPEDVTAWFCTAATDAAYDDRLSVDPDVDAAYAAARSARFEFGACGHRGEAPF